MSVFVVYTGLIGLAVGSFLALAADRIPRGESIVHTRSHCDACGRTLTWWELAPVLSYLGLRGRCYGCRAAIPVRLPLVEVLTGALFVLAALQYGASLGAAIVFLYSALLLLVSLIDLDRKLILNSLVFPSSGVALALAPLTPWGAEGGLLQAWGGALLGGGVGFGLMLGVYLLSRGGMGAGDVKLAGLIGLMTGFPAIVPALLVGFVSGGAVGVTLLLLRLRGRKDVIPYGPYLAFGGVMALLCGDTLLGLYLGILGVG
jgi:leader peptidase (prepilin peptidase)/N-methyltransferase